MQDQDGEARIYMCKFLSYYNSSFVQMRMHFFLHLNKHFQGRGIISYVFLSEQVQICMYEQLNYPSIKRGAKH